MALPDGLYDLLLTEGLARSLAAIDPRSADVLALKGGAAEFLADVIKRQLATILDDVSGDDADKAKRQLELVNELLVMLRHRLNGGAGSNGASAPAEVVDLVASPMRVLRAVQRDQQFLTSPDIGLAVPWLFTAGKGSPSLLQDRWSGMDRRADSARTRGVVRPGRRPLRDAVGRQRVPALRPGQRRASASLGCRTRTRVIWR